MDLASATNQPIEIPIAGKKYIVHRGSARSVGALQNWVNQQPQPTRPRVQDITKLPGPLLQLVAQEDAMARNAWPPEIASLDGWKALYTLPKGMVNLLVFALKKGQPEITEEQADSLMDELTYSQLQRIGIFFLQGVDIEGPLGLAAGTGPTPNGDDSPNKITLPTEEDASTTPEKSATGSS